MLKKKFWPPATHSEITLYWRQSQVRSLLSRSAGSLLSCPQMAPMPAFPNLEWCLGHLVSGMADKHTSHLLSWTLTFHLHGCPIVKPLSWWPSCAHNLLDPPATLSQHPINHHAFFQGKVREGVGPDFWLGSQGSFPAGQDSLCRLPCSCQSLCRQRGIWA